MAAGGRKDVQLGPPRERLPGSQAVDCASSLVEAFNVPKAIMQQSQLAARTWENIQEVKARQNKAKHLGARRARNGNGRQSPGILSYRAGRHGSDPDEEEEDDDGEGRNPTDLLDFVAALADKANSRLGGSELVGSAAATDANDADDGAAHTSAPNSPPPMRQARATASEPQHHAAASPGAKQHMAATSSAAGPSASLPTWARGSSDSLPAVGAAQRGQHNLSPVRASSLGAPLQDLVPRDVGDTPRMTPQKDTMLSPTRRHAAALGALGAVQQGAGNGRALQRNSSNGMDHGLAAATAAATTSPWPRSSLGVERNSAHVALGGSRRGDALSSSAEGVGGLLGGKAAASANAGTTSSLTQLPPALNLASPLMMMPRVAPPNASTPTPGGPSSSASVSTAGPQSQHQQAERAAPAAPALGRRAQALQAVFGSKDSAGGSLQGSPTSLLDLPASSPPSSTAQPSPAGDAAVGYVPSLLSDARGGAGKGASLPGNGASPWWNGPASGAAASSSLNAAATVGLPAARVQARMLQAADGAPGSARGRSTSTSGLPLGGAGGPRRERLWPSGADALAAQAKPVGRRG